MRILKHITYILSLVFLVIACKEDSTSKPSTENDEIEQRSSQTSDQEYLLEEDGIKITLPTGFNRYTAVEYQDYLNTQYKNEELKFENERFSQLRRMDGTLYIYVNPEDQAVYTFNSTPPTNLENIDAQALLNMVQSKHAEVEKVSKHKYEKVTARFNSNTSNKIFKAIYKVTGEDISEPYFAHTYIISNDNKTLYINLYSPGELDFDPYIEKMRF